MERDRLGFDPERQRYVTELAIGISPATIAALTSSSSALNESGTVALIDASPEGYKEHGRFDQPERSSKSSWPHPVVANGRLYLRDQDVLFCYDVAGK